MKWNLFFEVSHYFPRHKYQCVQKNDDDDETLDENAIEKREIKFNRFVHAKRFGDCFQNVILILL